MRDGAHSSLQESAMTSRQRSGAGARRLQHRRYIDRTIDDEAGQSVGFAMDQAHAGAWAPGTRPPCAGMQRAARGLATAMRCRRKAVSMASLSCQLHTRATICEWGLYAAQARKRPVAPRIATVPPAAGSPSMHSGDRAGEHPRVARSQRLLPSGFEDEL